MKPAIELDSKTLPRRRTARTVGELIAVLQGYPGDMPVVDCELSHGVVVKPMRARPHRVSHDSRYQVSGQIVACWVDAE